MPARAARPTGVTPVQAGSLPVVPAGAALTPQQPVPPCPQPRPPAAPPDASPATRGPATVGLWRWDAGSGLVSCTSQLLDLLGLDPTATPTAEALRDAVHPEDLPRLDEAIGRGGPGPVQETLRVVRHDEVRHVHAWWTSHRDAAGRLLGAFGGVSDLTGARETTAALAGALVGLRAVRELTGAGLWEWYPESGELSWSDEMFRLAGLAPGAVRPTLAHWHRLVHPDDVDRARRLDTAGLDAPDGRVETFRVVGADGRLRYVQGWATTVRDGVRGPCVVGAVVDVSRAVRDRMQLDRLSATDPVTGLENRRAYERRIAELLADPARDVALVLLDLDRFKQVNDSLGHQVGDRLLVEVARRLAGVVPPGSLTARMGGDEFVVVPPPGIGWLQVRRLAQSVVDALRMPYLLPGGEMLVCPASVGVTSTSGREVSPQDLLSEADLALYQAKDAGRDRYVVFDDAMRARARARHDAERMLRGALDEGRLTLRYQPVADLRTGRVVGAEALVRIRDPRGTGLVLPDAFIDVAEDTGLVVELDCWVIDTALDQLARWSQRVGPTAVPWVAVNVSARSMEHPRVVGRLLDGIGRRGLPTGAVKVELTERSFLGALPGGDSALRQLLDSRIPVGIDDFGTGYSALAYLQRYDLDFMKIDRSFVAGVGLEGRADAVVTAIVDLAHAHGMQVTAEGIESPRQAGRLAEIGCDLAQGWHVGRPGDAGAITAG